jgi:hypothetical protein
VVGSAEGGVGLYGPFCGHVRFGRLKGTEDPWDGDGVGFGFLENGGSRVLDVPTFGSTCWKKLSGSLRPRALNTWAMCCLDGAMMVELRESFWVERTGSVPDCFQALAD